VAEAPPRETREKGASGDSELRSMSAVEIAANVNAGALSAEEVVRVHLEAIQRSPNLHAFITVAGERALERARTQPRGLLAGVPLAPKDMFDTAAIRTTRGSAVFENRVPRRTAAAVAKLEAAGAVVIGKANQHEFAWGVTSQNPRWGDVRNPRRPNRTPGGSSGGNAAALAAGLCTVGLGTDTGGSVRIPSACCGTVGFKPSKGKIDPRGCFPLAPSFDTIGPMTRSVADCALVYSVLTGDPVPPPRVRGLRIGVWQALPRTDLDRWEELGAHLVEVVLREPEVDPSVVFQVEAALTHRGLFPAQRAKYGPDAQAKWDAAWQVPAMAYDAARRALGRWRASVQAELDVDLLVGPTLGMEIPPADAYEPAIRDDVGRYTRVFSWLRWPAIAIGNLQIGGPSDAQVIGAALAWEEATGAVTQLGLQR
jgi:Asp-tRNA(Asn)/Glu-tRNA(Gln) amidotransferase A subunit family amidase